MIVILCLDNKNGMMFNSRRQSRDKAIVQDILELTKGKRLFMGKYSEILFQAFNSNIIVDDNFLNNLDKDTYCFVEDNSLKDFADKIEKIIVYRWNRIYPSDLKLDIPIENWNMTDSFDFSGNSHDKITREVYVK